MTQQDELKFSLITADTRNRDDEWIEYGWVKCFINVEKKGGWRRGLESAILYKQSDADPKKFEPYAVVDRYHNLEPNVEVDKRLIELKNRGKIDILQQSRQMPDDYSMIWVLQPHDDNLNKEVEIGPHKFRCGAILRNNEGSVTSGITVYPMVYERIGNSTITPFIFQNYKIKGVRISKEPALYERSVIGLNDQIARCARKARNYMDSIRIAHETRIREDMISMILRHYLTINEDYLPGYLYESRSMRNNRVDVTILDEGKNKTLLDVCYDIVDAIWEYKQKRLVNAVVGVTRLSNGMFNTTEHIRLNKEFKLDTDDENEQEVEEK